VKITIKSTTQIVTIAKGREEIPARVWEGETDSGIKVTCLISRIAAHKDQDLSQFDAELKEQAPPAMEQVFPLRMII
jgi:hypothetical protein